MKTGFDVRMDSECLTRHSCFGCHLFNVCDTDRLIQHTILEYLKTILLKLEELRQNGMANN